MSADTRAPAGRRLATRPPHVGRRRRRGVGLGGRPWVTKLVAFAVIAVVWQVVVEAFGKDFMATPTGVLAAIPTVLFDDPLIWSGARETFGVVFRGLAVAIVLGCLLGLLMGRLPKLGQALTPYVNGFYATPMIAVLPVLTLWLGFNRSATLALVVVAALPPMAVAAFDGARSVPIRYLEVARSFGARRRDIWFGITLPSSLPYLLAGFRLASGRGLSAVVIAEFLIATGQGLGVHVMRLAARFHHDEAVVAVLILTFTGLVLAVGTDRLASRLLPWFRRS